MIVKKSSKKASLLLAITLLTSASVRAVGKKDIAHGAGYTVLTGASFVTTGVLTFMLIDEMSGNNSDKLGRIFLTACLVPQIYGLYSGVRGLSGLCKKLWYKKNIHTDIKADS